jgi:hypothetical protein
LEDPILNNLLLELSKLNQERTELSYNAKENNPLTEIIETKIKNTKKSLVENVSNMIDVSTVALTDINNRIFQIQKNLNVLPKNERELVNIQRRFDFNDNVYNYLLEKRAEAGDCHCVEFCRKDHCRQALPGWRRTGISKCKAHPFRSDDFGYWWCDSSCAGEGHAQ